MAKYCKEIVERICKLKETDSFTDREICEQVGINTDTYCTWKNDKPEFSECIKKAEQKFLNLIASEARKSLLKLVKGYSVQEKRTVYASEVKDGQSKPRIKEQTITDKHYQPDKIAVIFALTNQDNENFKNRQNTDLTTNGKELNINRIVLTKQEIEEISKQLNADC